MPEATQTQTALPDPQAGGSYTRCPETGELAPVQVPADPATTAAEQPAAPAQDQPAQE
jgi:hypothetical protein